MEYSTYIVLLLNVLVISANIRAGEANDLNYPDCSLQASCSPSFCRMLTDTACTFPDPGTNWAAEVASVTCKQCTQLSSSQCLGSTLASTLISTGDHVKAAYCNDQFLVIYSDGLSHWKDGLTAVPKPPGTDLKDGSKCIVRSSAAQYQVYKVPLTPTPLATGAKNTIPNSLNAVDLPIAGAVGVAINGMPIYPSLDASNLQLWEMCEADYCNCHAGKGGDYHIHGDPYGDKCMYTDKDKSTDGHPKMWGWALDGYKIYGRHTNSNDAGQGIALDTCGGHSHGDYGYHYHSHVVENSKTSGNDPNVAPGQAYTAFFAGPVGCWKGDISKISNFWQNGQQQVNYDMSKTNPRYTLSARNDYQDLRPCCSSTNFYAMSGVTVNGASGDGGASSPVPSGSGSSGNDAGRVMVSLAALAMTVLSVLAMAV